MDFCTVNSIFPVRSHLAFKANDSSYVFKILIVEGIVAKRAELLRTSKDHLLT